MLPQSAAAVGLQKLVAEPVNQQQGELRAFRELARLELMRHRIGWPVLVPR